LYQSELLFSMRDVFIVDAVRTPIGTFGGSLSGISPVDLAAHVMKASVERSGVDAGALDLYIFGNVLRGGHGQLIPRQAALKAGIPDHIDGFAVDMVCSSGMLALMQGASMIKADDADLVLTGGAESMSGTGFYLSSRARWGYKFLMGNPEGLTDLVLHDGLTDPMSGEAMGSQTERIAAEKGITREALDRVALASHKRAHEAWESGAYDAETAPIEYKVRRGTETLARDEGIRANTTTESLARLRPAFAEEGVLTAGSASQISDGASAIMLASERAVKEHGLTPLARIMGSGISAGASWRFTEAPIPAVRKALDKMGMSIQDFDLHENNEAFAINSILYSSMLEVDMERINVHGGAVALGHPIGCSGSRIVTTLTHALHRHEKGKGMAAICHGTGGGTAVALERV